MRGEQLSRDQGLDFFTGLTCCFFGVVGLRMRSTFHVLTTFGCLGLSIFLRQITFGLSYRIGLIGLLCRMSKKITFDTVRKIGLALPGVEEGTAYGTPALKVGGKLMACLAINKSAEPNTLGVFVDVDRRAELLTEAPDTYYLTDHYADHPCVLVRLSNIDEDALKGLLRMSWQFVRKKSRNNRRSGGA